VGDCEKVVEAICEATGMSDYSVLYSTKEYKKTRVRYFTAELEEWEAANGLRPAHTAAAAG
jgi:hypothetical protein